MNEKKGFFLASLAYVILGAVLLFFPDLSTGLICTAVGALLLLYGLVTVIGFFARKDGGSYSSQLDLVIGVFAVILGGVLLATPRLILSILPVVFGVYILIDGLMNLKRGLDMRAYGYAGWTATLVLAGVSLALGAVILWNPFSTHLLLVRIIGGAFLYQGIADLWATHTLDKLIREK